MKIALTFILATILSACGPLRKINAEYSGSPPIAVPAIVPYSNIKTLNVRFLLSSPPRANVKPAMSSIVWGAATTGPDTWMANIDVVKSVYMDALSQALKQQQRKCDVVDARVFPAQFMIDFTLKC